MSLKQTARPNLNFLLQGENCVLLLTARRTREQGPTWGAICSKLRVPLYAFWCCPCVTTGRIFQLIWWVGVQALGSSRFPRSVFSTATVRRFKAPTGTLASHEDSDHGSFLVFFKFSQAIGNEQTRLLALNS